MPNVASFSRRTWSLMVKPVGPVEPVGHHPPPAGQNVEGRNIAIVLPHARVILGCERKLPPTHTHTHTHTHGERERATRTHHHHLHHHHHTRMRARAHARTHAHTHTPHPHPTHTYYTHTTMYGTCTSGYCAREGPTACVERSRSKVRHRARARVAPARRPDGGHLAHHLALGAGIGLLHLPRTYTPFPIITSFHMSHSQSFATSAWKNTPGSCCQHHLIKQ